MVLGGQGDRFCAVDGFRDDHGVRQ